ncbi:hypothetical protein ATCVCanal1_758R [Acanthocystis turfacea Chlorella virus Canal-1]|nr:hypothetical protein ATCVCanal1_758R [Acanthocystis turfacea Chlorella virus Canal-1]
MFSHVLFLLLATSVAARHLTITADAPSSPTDLPSWAVVSTKHPWAIEKNRKTMADANAKGTPLDFVLYGDSITWYHVYQTNASFVKYFGQYNALAMGIGGDTVENLAYRMMVTEKPAVAPKNMIIMIGINNRNLTLIHQMFYRLETLLLWTRSAFPTTNIILSALTPENLGWGWVQKNQGYEAIAAKHGFPFAKCGLNLDPTNPAIFPDGLHPNAAGYDVILPCMARAMGYPVAGQPTTVEAWRELLLATGWQRLADGKWVNPNATCYIRVGLAECSKVTFYTLGDDPAYKGCLSCAK